MQGMPETPEQQLESFVAKFEPGMGKLIRECRSVMCKRFPTANELVYDNYNFFVIGYCTTERPSDAFISIAASAKGVGICFIHGASFPDPKRILQGSGKQTRFIHLDTAATIERPEVNDLLSIAADRSKSPLPRQGRGKLVIRSMSAKQRPRRRPQV